MARCQIVLIMGLALTFIAPSSHAQTMPMTLDWQDARFTDLHFPNQNDKNFQDYWNDRIVANNQFYKDKGDTRFPVGNAPAVEAHFIVYNTKRAVIVSVLDSATTCKTAQSDVVTGITLKMCQARIITSNYAKVEVAEAGNVCFLEQGRANVAKTSAGQMLFAFDEGSHAIRTAAYFKGQPHDDCFFNIPIPPTPIAYYNSPAPQSSMEKKQ